jgi:hypothetical protein
MGVRIGLGRGRRPPFPLLLPLPFPLSTPEKEGGILLGLGVLVGLPTLGAPLGGRPPPSPPLYTGAGAPPRTQQTLLAVCGAPSTVYSSGHIVVVLR